MFLAAQLVQPFHRPGILVCVSVVRCPVVYACIQWFTPVSGGLCLCLVVYACVQCLVVYACVWCPVSGGLRLCIPGPAIPDSSRRVTAAKVLSKTRGLHTRLSTSGSMASMDAFSQYHMGKGYNYFVMFKVKI